MESDSENILLRARVQQLQRVTRFKLAWLKKHHPEILEAMEAASAQNDDRYLEDQMKKFSINISRKTLVVVKGGVER